MMQLNFLRYIWIFVSFSSLQRLILHKKNLLKIAGWEFSSWSLLPSKSSSFCSFVEVRIEQAAKSKVMIFMYWYWIKTLIRAEVQGRFIAKLFFFHIPLNSILNILNFYSVHYHIIIVFMIFLKLVLALNEYIFSKDMICLVIKTCLLR